MWQTVVWATLNCCEYQQLYGQSKRLWGTVCISLVKKPPFLPRGKMAWGVVKRVWVVKIGEGVVKTKLEVVFWSADNDKSALRVHRPCEFSFRIGFLKFNSTYQTMSCFHWSHVLQPGPARCLGLLPHQTIATRRRASRVYRWACWCWILWLCHRL